MSRSSHVILGIDPGVARLGYGIVEEHNGQITCVEYGCLTTPKEQPLPERLLSLQQELRDIISKFKPVALGVETIRFAQNQTTGIAVAEARGVVLVVAAEAKLTIIEFSPLEIKEALTTYGHAEKKQVQFMVKQVLKLEETPQPDDAADALAVAIVTEQRYRFERLVRN